MAVETVGLLDPGEMGAALGAVLRGPETAEEIAATFEGAGLPGGFHRAAAEVYRRR
ncbi:MAG TPA: hypothetical protein VLD13_10450 [Gaiellaceae bacterium]|nr:hypothetical protein [Gaiellaceae bacterium]